MRIRNFQEVLFFFSESPMEAEGCGLHKVARVGRVCEDDPGGRYHHLLSHHFRPALIRGDWRMQSAD